MLGEGATSSPSLPAQPPFPGPAPPETGGWSAAACRPPPAVGSGPLPETWQSCSPKTNRGLVCFYDISCRNKNRNRLCMIEFMRFLWVLFMRFPREYTGCHHSSGDVVFPNRTPHLTCAVCTARCASKRSPQKNPAIKKLYTSGVSPHVYLLWTLIRMCSCKNN